MFDLSLMLNDDTVENVEETPKTDEELVDEGSDIEVADTELSAKALVFSRGLDEVIKIKNHIATFGVDRALLSLYNDKGQLSKCLNVNIPSCESFDEAASPSSALSIACLEALDNQSDGLVGRIKAFVLELIEKIKSLVTKFWQWLKDVFGNTRAKFNRYEAIRKGSSVKVGENLVSVEIPKKFAEANIIWSASGLIDNMFSLKLTSGAKTASVDKIASRINDFVKIKQDKKTIGVDFKNAKKVTEKLEKDIKRAFENEERLVVCDREITNILKKVEFEANKVADTDGAYKAKKAVMAVKQKQSVIQKFLALYAAYVRGLVNSYAKLVSAFYQKSES